MHPAHRNLQGRKSNREWMSPYRKKDVYFLFLKTPQCMHFFLFASIDVWNVLVVFQLCSFFIVYSGCKPNHKQGHCLWIDCGVTPTLFCPLHFCLPSSHFLCKQKKRRTYAHPLSLKRGTTTLSALTAHNSARRPSGIAFSLQPMKQKGRRRRSFARLQSLSRSMLREARRRLVCKHKRKTTPLHGHIMQSSHGIKFHIDLLFVIECFTCLNKLLNCLAEHTKGEKPNSSQFHIAFWILWNMKAFFTQRDLDRSFLTFYKSG